MYRQLQKHLNTLPIGFPSTLSGVEIRILKYLFTSEEAQLTLNLTINFENVSQINERIPNFAENPSILEEKLNNLYLPESIRKSKLR